MGTRVALAVAGVVLIAAAIATMDQTVIRAHLGGTDSQLKLAYAYGTGQGVEEDQEEAVRWYRRVAERGDPRGQLALAARYDEGMGVELDPEEATRWYREAARQGDPQAQLAMALRHDQGRGAPEDKVQAAMWLILADRYIADRADGMALLVKLKELLSEEELAEARRLADEWRQSYGQR